MRLVLGDALRWLATVAKKLPTPEPISEKPQTFTWVDLRDEPRTKDRGKSKGIRDYSAIKGITLHQTAADLGTNPNRFLNVPSHGGTLSDGTIVTMHDPTDLLWHAHALNKHDIGIEVSCRAAGIEGESKTFWRNKRERAAGKPYEQIVKEASDIQLAATLELCRFYIKQVADNGGRIEYIHAHRQGHKSRRGDPGSRIWQKVAMQLIEEFNLSCGPIGWAAGSGKPIPEEWDPIAGEGVPY